MKTHWNLLKKKLKHNNSHEMSEENKIVLAIIINEIQIYLLRKFLYWFIIFY